MSDGCWWLERFCYLYLFVIKFAPLRAFIWVIELMVTR